MAIYVDDRELLAAHRAGDTGAFDELVREHRGSLYRHAYKRLLCNESAEDAVQETLVRAYRALPNFKGEYRLGPWLHRIMQNVCVDEANRRKKDADKIDRVASLSASNLSSPSVEDELRLNFDDTELQHALCDLPGPYREALVDRFVHEMNYHEVAQKTGVTEQNARARVSRAKSFMRASLKGVAVLPLLLIGLLKRGEKVAAAATSTSSATMAVASTTTISATTQLASTTAPAVVEAANIVAHAAPMALPVIAKAAVGIGIAAAVFAPATDSPVHTAVEELTSSSVIVAEVSPLDGPKKLNVPIELVSGASIKSVAEEPKGVTAADEEPRISEALVVDESILPSTSVEIRLESSDVSFVLDGPGQYELNGVINVPMDGALVEGVLQAPSQIRLSSDNIDQARRMDALFVLRLPNGEAIDVRLAGFAETRDLQFLVSGLFRADVDNETELPYKGSFSGVIKLGEPKKIGSLSITLIK